MARRAVRWVSTLAAAWIVGAPTALVGQGWPNGAPPAGATVYRTGRFVIAAYRAEARLAGTLLARAVASDAFPGLPPLRDTVWVALAPDRRTFRAWVGPSAPEWGAAIAFPARRLVVMQGRDAGSDAGDPVQTLRHELAHLALAEVLGDDVPRWFDEGYASYAAGEWGRGEVLATSLGLVWRGVPTFAALDSAFLGGAAGAERAYAFAHHAVADLAAAGAGRGLAPLFGSWASGAGLDGALRARYGVTLEGFEAGWRGRVRRQYGLLALATDLSLFSLVVGLLFGPVWWRRRGQARDRLAEMRAREATQEARDRASALAALLGEGGRAPSAERSGPDAR